MKPSDLKPGLIVRGPLLPEPVRVITTMDMGDSLKLVGVGLESGMAHQPILSPEQLAALETHRALVASETLSTSIAGVAAVADNSDPTVEVSVAS